MMKQRRYCWASLSSAMTRLVLALVFVCMCALPVAAATYTVANTDDSGTGSLRQAILDANANAGADIIDATGVSGTITINPANYFLVITDDVTILGPGQANLTISGGGASRIFWIQNGTITIQDLTLANGYAKGGNGGGGGMGAGGAIFMHEGRQDPNTATGILSGSINLTLINVTLKDNDAIGGNGGLGNGGGGGMGGNGSGPANPDGNGLYGGAGGVLGNAISWEYGGSVTDATLSARGTNGGIAIFGSGGKYGNSAVGFGGGGSASSNGGFAGGGQNAQDGGGSGGRGGFGGGGGGAANDNNFLNNGGRRGGFGGGGGGLGTRGNGSNGDGGGDDGQGGFGGGNGTNTGGGGMGAGGAIFVASGTLTMKSVTFQNNTATGGTGGNDGQGLGGALFIFDKADNGGNAAPGTTNDPQVTGCDLTFSGNTASTSNNDTYGSIGFASGCPLILTAEGPAGPVASGAPVTVTIKAEKFTNLGTLQFSINWDPSELQLDGNTPLTIDGDAPVIGTPVAGQLTYTWFDADIDYGVTLPDGTTILTLNFTVATPGPATDVNVTITDTPTTVEASDNNFEVVPVTLENLVSFDVTAPITVKPFVFAANKVTLRSTKQSMPAGDIHSNGLLTVEKGYPSTYLSNLTAKGKITIYAQNTINGNVKSQTSISNAGTITGTKSVGAVDDEALPSLSYSAGGPNKTVPIGGALTLAPGSYGTVTMNSNGTLKLSSGEYFFNALRYASTVEGGRIAIDLASGDPITINVVNNLQLGHEAAIVLLPNGEADSKLVTVNTRQSTAVTLGREAYLLGSFNAPNAIVTLVKNSQLRGSLCAKEIIVSNDCLFLHHDSPGSLPGPGNLPKFSGDEEVSSDQLTVISDYVLEQNYPNPFNPSTTITFALPEAREVTLSIFNTNGQLVKRLIAGAMNAGQHSFTWDATNERGERVASGVYLYVIKAGEFTAQRKLILMK